MKERLDASSEKSPKFDEMVGIWKGQVRARYYREGTIVGDETIEAMGATLGLDETEISDAFLAAKEIVDKEQEGTTI